MDPLTLFTKVKEIPNRKVIPIVHPDVGHPKYAPFNPNIIRSLDNKTYICNVREANYDPGSYRVREDSGNYINTRNFIQILDENLSLIETHELIDGCPPPPCPDTCLPHGYEDLRMFHVKGELYFIAVFCLLTDTFIPEIVMCHVNTSTWTVDERTHVFVQKNRCEKNWMPLVIDDIPYVIYRPQPLMMYKINDDRSMSLVMNKVMTTSKVDEGCRGSGGICHVRNMYIGICHEVVFLFSRRIYIHKFVVYDDRFMDEGKFSEPFVFFHHGIEFCCGMTLSLDEKEMIMSVGIEDVDCLLISVNVDDLLSTYFSL